MKTPLSIDDFIIHSKLIHGNKYDYSNSVYINTNTKLEIICPKHKSFFQRPNNHLNGNGCPSCCNNKKLSIVDFVSNSRRIHGDKYDYSKVNYINGHTNVIIICPQHGEFKQSFTSHIYNKSGCRQCAGNNIVSTTIKFIKKANIIHNNKYDYSNTNYIRNSNKVTIICKIHGNFEQIPSNHLKGKGCIKCTKHISKPETEFLNHLNISIRNYHLPEWKHKAVDGYDDNTKTIYEFLGDYWHGNPVKYNTYRFNPKKKITFGQLYEKTMNSLLKIKSFGYNVKYTWENDWNKFKKGIDKELNIITI
jgi:hypothetical protein